RHARRCRGTFALRKSQPADRAPRPRRPRARRQADQKTPGRHRRHGRGQSRPRALSRSRPPRFQPSRQPPSRLWLGRAFLLRRPARPTRRTDRLRRLAPPLYPPRTHRRPPRLARKPRPARTQILSPELSHQPVTTDGPTTSPPPPDIRVARFEDYPQIQQL